MGSVRIEINEDGIRELLKSAEVRADLRRRAEAIAHAAGGEPDYIVDEHILAHRARASVRTGTPEAMRAEAEDRTLTKALDAGRS